MCANFSKKSLLLAAAVFCMVGSIPAFAQTSAASGECRIEVCYVKMTAEGFDPENLVIGAGSTVVWKNVDEKAHSLDLISGEMHIDSIIIRPGETYSYKFAGKELNEFTFFDAENSSSGQLSVGPAPAADEVNKSKVDFTDERSGIRDISLISGSVTGAAIIPRMKALELDLDVQSHDVLQISIDRKLLDSRAHDADMPFSIRSGNNVLDYDEVDATSAHRTLRVALPADTESIVIRGNSMSAEPLGYQRAYSTLSEAASVVASYKARGVVTKEADDLLLQATDAAASGKYHFAQDLANEAIEAAQRADRIAIVATSVMNEAESSIKATKSLGGDVSQAEELLDHTKEVYSYGGYEEALNLANYARDAALTKINPLLIAGGTGMASAGVLYAIYRRQQGNGKPATPIEEHIENNSGAGLEVVFVEKPHLREDDRLVLKYIVDKGGEALLAEIRNAFSLPKSTAWRLMRRLEREELVEITKFGNQNMVKYKLKTQAY